MNKNYLFISTTFLSTLIEILLFRLRKREGGERGREREREKDILTTI